MSNDQVRMIVSLSASTREAFEKLCVERGITSSQILRDYIQSFLVLNPRTENAVIDIKKGVEEAVEEAVTLLRRADELGNKELPLTAEDFHELCSILDKSTPMALSPPKQSQTPSDEEIIGWIALLLNLAASRGDTLTIPILMCELISLHSAITQERVMHCYGKMVLAFERSRLLSIKSKTPANGDVLDTSI